MYGLGNWADIAEHVGGRTKEECHDHYVATYIESEAYPLPVGLASLPFFSDATAALNSHHTQHVDQDFSPTDTEPFQQRKKARLEELQSRPIPLPPPKPLASAPTCHEIAGYMPGRLEFEHEYENDAEVLIKDLEFGKVYHFGGDSQPAAPPAPAASGADEGGAAVAEGAGEQDGAGGEGAGADGARGDGADKEEKPLPEGEQEGDEPEPELELKLAILDMFNERYDKRMASKELIFDRGLINYKVVRHSRAPSSFPLPRTLADRG